MENYYEVLECTPDATQEQLKQAYQRKILQHHPDKQQQASGGVSQVHDASVFHAVTKAWKVLGDADLRREYDARWTQNVLVQQWPVQDDIPLEEFEWEAGIYDYACRCGSSYSLTETDTFFRVDLVQCSSCSLCVRVLYPEDFDDSSG